MTPIFSFILFVESYVFVFFNEALYLEIITLNLSFKEHPNKQFHMQMVTLLLKHILKRTPYSTLAFSPTLSSVRRLFTSTYLNFGAQLLTSVHVDLKFPQSVVSMPIN